MRPILDLISRRAPSLLRQSFSKKTVPKSMAHHHHHRRQHFLVVALGAQGHINPARHLARLLAQTSPSIRVAIAVPIQTLRLMYPDTTLNPESPIIDQENPNPNPNSISFVPYSDGIEDDGLDPVADLRHLPNFNRRITDSLTRFALNADPPVTCIVHTLVLSVAADVARSLGVPSVLFWIQPAAVFAVYYHYFSVGTSTVSSLLENIPGLPRLEIQDLPSLLTDENGSKSGVSSFMLALLQEEFRMLSQQISAGARPKVLVNTFEDLESSVLASLEQIEMIAIGPLISTASTTTPAANLFRQDNSPYTEWLDSKEESAVLGMPMAAVDGLRDECEDGGGVGGGSEGGDGCGDREVFGFGDGGGGNEEEEGMRRG